MLNRLFTSAAAWTAIGLLSGLYWREFTKLNEFTGETMLSTAHTHALALGTLVFLAVLGLIGAASALKMPEVSRGA